MSPPSGRQPRPRTCPAFPGARPDTPEVPPPGARPPSCHVLSLEGGAVGRAEKMFPLPLPAAARVALRRLGVRRLWDRGLSTADMTKVSGVGSPGRPRVLPWLRAAGWPGWSRPRCVGRTHQVAQLSGTKKSSLSLQGASPSPGCGEDDRCCLRRARPSPPSWTVLGSELRSEPHAPPSSLYRLVHQTELLKITRDYFVESFESSPRP